MKNKKLLLGIGALVLVLVGGLVANSSGLLQGKVRNLRSPKSISTPAALPAAPPPRSSTTSTSSSSDSSTPTPPPAEPPAPAPTVDLLFINGSNGPVTLPTYGGGFVDSYIQVVSWTSTNATSCTASSGTNTPIMFWSGDKAVSGQQNVQAFPNGLVLENTLVLTCTNENGDSASDSLTLIKDPPPSIDFLINGVDTPVVINAGTEVELSWTTTNAASCEGLSTSTPGVLSEWIGPKSVNGAQVVTIANSIGAVRISCTSPTGSAGFDSVGVNVMTVDLKANGSNGPVTATTGSGSAATGVGTVTLSWNAPNATACTASSSIETVGWTGSKPTSGSAVINVPSARQFSLNCLAPGLESVSDSVDVNLIAVDLKVNNQNGPITITTGSAAAGGGTVTLSWNSTNATACSASSSIGTNGWTGSKPISGSTIINVPSTREFSLACSGPLGNASDSVVVGIPD